MNGGAEQSLAVSVNPDAGARFSTTARSTLQMEGYKAPF
jgi:hypothetical protein